MSAAASSLARDVAAGLLSPDDIDENMLSSRMSLADKPAPDLVFGQVVNGGFNFLLWHFAYAELWFTDTLLAGLWSDELDVAIEHFRGRDRRFGARPAGRVSSVS